MVQGRRGCEGSQNVGEGAVKGVRMWTERVIFSVRECAEGGCGGAGEGAVKGVRMWTERVIFSVRECAEGGCGGAGEKGL